MHFAHVNVCAEADNKRYLTLMLLRTTANRVLNSAKKRYIHEERKLLLNKTKKMAVTHDSSMKDESATLVE